LKPLIIHVDDIDTARQPWEQALPREELDEMLGGDLPSEFKAGGAAQVKALLTKMGKKVLVQSSFTVPLAGVCKRCLKEVALTGPVELTLTFNPRAEEHKHGHGEGEGEGEGRHKGRERDIGKDRGDGDSAGSFALENTDEETYTSKSIDLWPYVREQVLLAAPPSPLCKEDCKGLCPSCGQDLNTADCGHREEKIDPRWEALKGLKLPAAEEKPKKKSPKQQPKQRKE
jgi:uncharacterized protein